MKGANFGSFEDYPFNKKEKVTLPIRYVPWSVPQLQFLGEGYRFGRQEQSVYADAKLENPIKSKM